MTFASPLCFSLNSCMVIAAKITTCFLVIWPKTSYGVLHLLGGSSPIVCVVSSLQFFLLIFTFVVK